MNNYNAKKLRQIHRKTLNRQIDKFFEQVVRPRPRWLPSWLWWKIVNRVLKIQTQYE